jgi:hypothetical protein
MSVIVMLQMDGDAGQLEQYAESNQEKMADVVGQAKDHGLIAHRFFGDDNGHLYVIDEWPDAQSFQAFFGEAQAEIGPMMQAAGVTSQPQPQVLRVLETHDKYGWDGTP